MSIVGEFHTLIESINRPSPDPAFSTEYEYNLYRVTRGDCFECGKIINGPESRHLPMCPNSCQICGNGEVVIWKWNDDLRERTGTCPKCDTIHGTIKEKCS